MEKKKTDRRVLRTKRLLTEGLMTLLMQKDIKDISVRELADYADINRCTFYLHYKDIYDMIEKIEDELFLELNEILDLSGDTGSSPDPSPVLNNIFEFLYQNQTAIAAFLGPHGDRAFLNKIKELFKERMFSVWEEHSYQAENFEYYNSFIISGCIGMVEFWVQNNFQKSAEEMAQLARGMILEGMGMFSPQPL